MNSKQVASAKRSGAKIAGAIVAVGLFLIGNPELVNQAAAHISAIKADVIALAAIGATLYGVYKSHVAHADKQ